MATSDAAMGADRSWCLVVPAHAQGARAARRRIVAELGPAVGPTLLADAVAVLAELVGNAVRHADPLPGGVVRVAWRLRPASTGDVVEIRVTDGGGVTTPAPRTVSLTSADGRGLRIVAALSSAWGVDRDGLGQSVWARVTAAAPAGPDHPAAAESTNRPAAAERTTRTERTTEAYHPAAAAPA